MQKFKLINKTLYFPEKEILVIGDLHLGYEEMLKEQGIMFPFNQLETTKKHIKSILEKLKKQGCGLKKIILLGDIKHYFNFQVGEKISVRAFLKFLSNYVANQNIILIKGNHDKIELDKKKYYDFYIKDDIAFIHGHKSFPKIFDKKIKTIVMGHLHPVALIKDPNGIKKEKYKCFLIGKYKKKEFIIVPSFFPLVKGTAINDLYNLEKGKKQFSIIPKNKLKDFETFIIGKNKIYNFGKFKDLY